MFYDGHVHIEEEDQCYTCEYFLKGVMCPLLEALAVGVAHLDGDIMVRNCGFYKEFKRHLHVVENQEDDGNTPPDMPDIQGDANRPERSRRFRES
jgi:hypothetical protein